MTYIINLPLNTGVVHDQMNLAHVVALFQSDDKSSFSKSVSQKLLPRTSQILSTCAVLHDAVPTTLRRLNDRALGPLGTRIKESHMATRKRTRKAEVCYRNVERGVRLQTEKIRQKIAEKMDQGKFYATEETA